MIISVSGKINSGKDTVGKIIQILTKSPHFTNKAVVEFLERDITNPVFEIRKWADTLKDIVCLLIGCTRADLEDREFKEKELGEEWWYYQDAEKKIFPVNETTQVLKAVTDLIKPTPRLLLQLLGTECGRQIIHPNIWVNALMSGYKAKGTGAMMGNVIDYSDCAFPKWVITDTRFPNEVKAVKERKGINIRVNRTLQPNEIRLLHESEIVLDNYNNFDYVITNDGTLEDLVKQVKRILQAEFIETTFNTK